jgi:hypothetical protein
LFLRARAAGLAAAKLAVRGAARLVAGKLHRLEPREARAARLVANPVRCLMTVFSRW